MAALPSHLRSGVPLITKGREVAMTSPFLGYATLLACIVVSTSCNSERDVVFTRHPTQLNDVLERDIAHHITDHIDTTAWPEARELLRRLPFAEHVIDLTSPPNDKQPFGELSDIAVLSETQVAVSDRNLGLMYIFEYLPTTRGLTLVETRHVPSPMSLAPLPQAGVLAISDGQSAVAVAENGESPAPSFPLVRKAKSVCRLGDKLHFRTEVPSGTQSLFTQYTLGGTLTREFGHVYLADKHYVQAMLSAGPLACDESSQTLITMISVLPYVYAYGPDGTVKWISKLDNFRSATSTEQVYFSFPSGRSRTTFKSGESSLGTDRPATLINMAPGVFMAQIARMVRVGDDTPAHERWIFRSYLINAATGAGVYIGESVPLFMAATRSVLFGFRPEPVPVLSVYTY